MVKGVDADEDNRTVTTFQHLAAFEERTEEVAAMLGEASPRAAAGIWICGSWGQLGSGWASAGSARQANHQPHVHVTMITSACKKRQYKSQTLCNLMMIRLQ